MKRLVFLLALAVGTGWAASAARRVTVQQMELLLDDAKGREDGKAAKQFSGLELTERVSRARLARWQAEFPGRRCREALTRLADEAAFLELPAMDMSATAPPDRDAQRAMLARAVEYVNTAVKRLPNFYATRASEHFEDTPMGVTNAPAGFPASGRGMRSGGIRSAAPGESDYVPLHTTGTSKVTVSYRDGYEMANSKRATLDGPRRGDQGLTTTGEFGPILSLVLGDAMRGRLGWGFWELDGEGESRMVAVFRYTVPQGQSSYLVAMPRVMGGSEQIYPAYHGEIAIDPETGAILRIMVVADLAAPYQRVHTAILVEYGEVLIGGTSYICPLKGVAVSKIPPLLETGGVDQVAPLRTEMNDVTFSDYHLFRSESRIVPAGDSGDAPSSGPQ